MDDNQLHDISTQTIQRYSERYERHGYDLRSLGWDTSQHQEYRFLQTLDAPIDWNNKTVLDIGCGFGDYFHFLQKHSIPFKNYIGWDLNDNLIQEAKKQLSDPKCGFATEDILSTHTAASADIGVMLGLINYNFHGKYDNEAVAETFIQKAFQQVNELLIVDFMSAQRNPNHPPEDVLYYYEPAKMLDMAFKITPRVLLKHEYDPIPHREGMLFLFKEKSDSLS